eukprot:CAMPEP_0198283296 /NCGR_PEP_ID=MMETSP1449-20131203/2943_1 /TAXON_ID=420275 /ORGANISM="Attheya septentrionalis, Strain CCMP2084" /LENGTH=477 /DNA_ID=CAMNT_0043979877 /DNA_START=173 /DNA_END=1606 /DNA_ORIENTATION=+
MASVAKVCRTTSCSTMLLVCMVFLTSKHTSRFTSAEKSDLERVRQERRKRTEESHMQNRALTQADNNAKSRHDRVSGFDVRTGNAEETGNDANARSRHTSLFGIDVRAGNDAELRHSKFTMEFDQENPKNQRVFTPAPSPNPSSAPSKSSIPSLSMAPSKSYEPTSSHAPIFSAVPSIVPSNSPSASPSSDCTVPTTGLFGSSANNGTRVTYTYEMIIKQEVFDTDAQVQSTVLPLVERAITSSLVPTLFEDTCGGNRRILTQQQHQHHRRLKLVGVGPKPSDVIINNVDCQVVDTPNLTSCVVVNGGFTMFSDDPNENLVSSGFDALVTISTTMNRGDYNSVHSSIVNLTYTTFSYDSLGGTTTSASTRESGLSTVGVVLIILSSILVVGAVLFFVWQRQQRLVDDGDQDESYYNTQRVSPHTNNFDASEGDLFDKEDTKNFDDSEGDLYVKEDTGGANMQYKSANSIATGSYGQY